MDSEEMWMRHYTVRMLLKKSPKRSVKKLIKDASLVADFTMNKPKGKLVSLPERKGKG